MGPKTSIEKVSPESESTSKKIGDIAEKKAQRYFHSLGFKLIATNEKYFGVEVDQVYFKDHYYFVEVKKLRNWDEMYFRVSMKQVKRLLFARKQFEAFSGSLVELKFAFVGAKDVVVVSPEDLNLGGECLLY